MSDTAGVRANVIGVLSGKGGVGKTTVVANLGAALASKFHKKVLLIDSSVKTSHLGLHLGLYEELPVTLKEVLLKKVPVMYAIFFHPTTGVRLLPAPLKGDVNLKRMNGIIEELGNAYDPIVVDCAPGLGKDVVLAVKSIDKVLLVTTPDLPSVTDVLKTIDLVKKLKKDIIGIVLNRVRNEKHELTVEEIESTCGYDVVSVIPETNKIPESIAEGVPLVMNSSCSAAVELKKLAAGLIGAGYQPDGFLYRLKKLFSIQTKVVVRRPKNSFVREVDMDKEEYADDDGVEKKIKGEKKKLIKDSLKEEQSAIDEMRTELRKDFKRKGKLKKDVYGSDLEKEIMERVKERLKNKMR